MYEKTTVVGYLGSDPELRFTHSGDAVCNFSVAVNKSYTDESGAKHEKVKWFKIVAWRKLGQLCNEYLAKGRLVLVEGEVAANHWIGDDGKVHTSLELTAKTVRFLGGGTNGNGKAAPVQATEDDEVPF